ncbi:MAG TPA: hypothetical protein VN228_01855, partial [Pyrinomonadaceae bacterium]|nr:hypothetical protein [Pyrinomonadaceae bacterium]
MSDYNRAAKCYWAALVAAGACALAWGVYHCLFFAPVEWARLLVLASLVVISGFYPVRIPGTKASVTVGDCFVFLGIIFLGVQAGVVLGALDLFTSSVRTSRRVTSWVAAPAASAVTGCVAGRLFYLALAADGVARHPVGWTQALPLGQLILPLVLMALAQYLVNGVLVATLLALKSRRSIWAYWRDGYLWTSWTFFAGALAAGLVYAAIMRFGVASVIL